MSEASLKSITVGNGPAERRIAVRLREGQAPGVVWLGGFKSDMQGTKAVALDEWAARTGRACLRFDYSGHGESSGDFADGTIGLWLEDSVAAFERFCTGPQILIGSSMGGWMALLPALTMAGLTFGELVGGSVVTEAVFARHGIGALTVDAVANRDTSVLLAIVVLAAAVFVLINLIVDLLYPVLDVRLREGSHDSARSNTTATADTPAKNEKKVQA